MRETKESSLPADSALLGPSIHDLVLVICDRDGPTSVPLPEHAELTIGRCNSCHCVLKDPAVSRVHARFSYLDGQVWVEDLSSRHGTWIAGKRIERAPLPLGSSVRVADVTIVVTRAVATSSLPGSLEPQLPEALYLSSQTRELRNVLTRAAALGQGATLCVDDLPSAIAQSRRSPADTLQPAPAAELELRAQLAAMEHAEVTRALERTGGNQRAASALLGMPLRTFERRLQRIRQRQAIAEELAAAQKAGDPNRPASRVLSMPRSSTSRFPVP